MIIFPGQFDGFRITKIGDRVMSIRTYEEYAEEVSRITNGKMGQEYLIIAIPTDKKEELAEWKNETEEETTKRFKRQMEALISDIAEIKGIEKEGFREEVKAKLIKEGLIEKSTNELKIEGLASVISRLKKLKHDTERETTAK